MNITPRRLTEVLRHISVLGARVNIFMSQLLHPQRKSPTYTLNKRLCGLQKEYELCRKENNAYVEKRKRIPSCITRDIATVLTELSQQKHSCEYTCIYHMLSAMMLQPRNWNFRQHEEIFGPKRDEVTGEWRKLHNEELHNLYSSPNIIRTIK
jgi:hypothetical protein